MSGQAIKARFLALYPKLMDRLVRRLGSQDAAGDALNETYLKLDRVSKVDHLREPEHYLFRMAVNTAIDQQRAGKHLANAQEIEAAMALSDPLDDPLRSLEGREAIDLLAEIIDRLPERRRIILKEVRLEGKSCKKVAEEMSLSRRTVEMELRQALDQCAESLRKFDFDYATVPHGTSLQ